MSTDVEVPPKPSAASLVSGILGDFQHLVQQQLQLTLREIEAELRLRGIAAAIFGLAAGVLFLAGIALSQALSHLLHWTASPPGTDPASFPLWACHFVVAAVLFVIGGTLVLVGRARFRCTNACQNPASEFLQEQATWPTHPK